MEESGLHDDEIAGCAGRSYSLGEKVLRRRRKAACWHGIGKGR